LQFNSSIFTETSEI